MKVMEISKGFIYSNSGTSKKNVVSEWIYDTDK
jgi:hypothetical protein